MGRSAPCFSWPSRFDAGVVDLAGVYGLATQCAAGGHGLELSPDTLLSMFLSQFSLYMNGLPKPRVWDRDILGQDVLYKLTQEASLSVDEDTVWRMMQMVGSRVPDAVFEAVTPEFTTTTPEDVLSCFIVAFGDAPALHKPERTYTGKVRKVMLRGTLADYELLSKKIMYLMETYVSAKGTTLVDRNGDLQCTWTDAMRTTLAQMVQTKVLDQAFEQAQSHVESATSAMPAPLQPTADDVLAQQQLATAREQVHQLMEMVAEAKQDVADKVALCDMYGAPVDRLRQLLQRARDCVATFPLLYKQATAKCADIVDVQQREKTEAYVKSVLSQQEQHAKEGLDEVWRELRAMCIKATNRSKEFAALNFAVTKANCGVQSAVENYGDTHAYTAQARQDLVDAKTAVEQFNTQTMALDMVQGVADARAMLAARERNLAQARTALHAAEERVALDNPLQRRLCAAKEALVQAQDNGYDATVAAQELAAAQHAIHCQQALDAAQAALEQARVERDALYADFWGNMVTSNTGDAHLCAGWLAWFCAVDEQGRWQLGRHGTFVNGNCPVIDGTQWVEAMRHLSVGCGQDRYRITAGAFSAEVVGGDTMAVKNRWCISSNNPHLYC